MRLDLLGILQSGGKIHYTVNRMLLPSVNPFKCHEEVLSLQPMI